MMSDHTRREFLASCGILAASLMSCRSVDRSARVAASFVADPAIEDYGDALRALIEAILPDPDRAFPLTAREVEARLLKMFPLEEERRFLGVQRTLVYFDQIDLAPHVAAPLVHAERLALDVPARMTEGEFRRSVAGKVELESAACEDFTSAYRGARFSELSLAGRRVWLDLWAASEFAVKREFAKSVRAVTLIAAYSADELWRAIDYSGTLIGRPRRSG